MRLVKRKFQEELLLGQSERKVVYDSAWAALSRDRPEKCHTVSTKILINFRLGIE
ncbi:hypothetical protein NC653_029235 [Populus alba x Populus x berolinensis]|uniref:Uncharacterized protein n=1 Tax=Populus alba x Populus x berolinensis TaxID=444605 RepID=A0AAD6M1H3_9ROSI|nr:hypothetical protein NC653_029235 [Populus alba x Populus x berolinensis]